MKKKIHGTGDIELILVQMVSIIVIMPFKGLECSIAKGCEFCQGFSYDESESGTNFQKAKYICKMHKARVRANNYYFAKLYHEKGIKRENFYWKKELIFILDDDYSSYCSYNNTKSVGEKYMRTDEILRGLEFA